MFLRCRGFKEGFSKNNQPTEIIYKCINLISPINKYTLRNLLFLKSKIKSWGIDRHKIIGKLLKVSVKEDVT